jgi:hypothetical protein
MHEENMKAVSLIDISKGQVDIGADGVREIRVVDDCKSIMNFKTNLSSPDNVSILKARPLCLENRDMAMGETETVRKWM